MYNGEQKSWICAPWVCLNYTAEHFFSIKLFSFLFCFDFQILCCKVSDFDRKSWCLSKSYGFPFTYFSSVSCLYYRVCTESWILEKVLKFAPQFSRTVKVWKMEIKSGKTLKNLEVFFKATTSAFRSEFLFQFGQILYSVSPVRLQHTVKKALFLCFLRSR